MKKLSPIEKLISKNVAPEHYKLFGYVDYETKSIANYRLRNALFGKDFKSIFNSKKDVTRNELREAFVKSKFVKTGQDFESILPELKNLTLDYSTKNSLLFHLNISQVSLFKYHVKKWAHIPTLSGI